MKKKVLLFIIIPIAVIVFGLIGFCGFFGYTFYEGLLASLKFLTLEFGGATKNVFVEISRWLGVLFYLSLIYAVAYALFEVIRMFFRIRNADATALHGDSHMVKSLEGNIRGGKGCVISDSKASFKAKKQIIWFSDDTRSVNFYETNKALLAKDEVYIALSSIPVDGAIEENVHLFNVNENIAVSYWEKHFVTEPKKIVLIGSGPLAEQMLEQGLLMNVYAKRGGLQYHVIGDFDLYQSMHPSLQEAVSLTQDVLTFSKDPWYMQMDVIRAADRIILADDDKRNVEMASLLQNYGLHSEIHLRSESEETKVLFRAENVCVFGTLKEILGADGENLFQDGIHRAGKMLDAAYGVLSQTVGTEDIDKKAEEAFAVLASKSQQEWADGNTRWSNLSGFLKRSNYTVAKHAVVKKQILQKALPSNGTSYEELVKDGVKGMRAFWNDPANKALVDELQEIEHLRWWRLYLLNNFTYDENVQPEERMMLRKNPNMKAYEQLDDLNKKYDGIFYWMLPFLEG